MEPWYYDKEGRQITAVEWSNLYSPEYKRVAESRLSDGRWVSTVWLGINHNFSPDGPPIIFETMAFTKDFEEEACYRASTIEEARSNHAFAVMEMAYHDPPVKHRQLIHKGRKP